MATQFGSFNRSPLGAFIQSPLGVRGGALKGNWFYQNSSFQKLHTSGDGLVFAELNLIFSPVDVVGDVVVGRGGILLPPYQPSDFLSGIGGGSMFGKILRKGSTYVYRHGGDLFAFSPSDAPTKSLYVIRGDGYSATDYEVHANKGVGCFFRGSIYYIDTTTNLLHKASPDLSSDVVISTSPSTLPIYTFSDNRLVAVGMED